MATGRQLHLLAGDLVVRVPAFPEHHRRRDADRVDPPVRLSAPKPGRADASRVRRVRHRPHGPAAGRTVELHRGHRVDLGQGDGDPPAQRQHAGQLRHRRRDPGDHARQADRLPRQVRRADRERLLQQDGRPQRAHQRSLRAQRRGPSDEGDSNDAPFRGPDCSRRAGALLPLGCGSGGSTGTPGSGGTRGIDDGDGRTTTGNGGSTTGTAGTTGDAAAADDG